MNLSHELTRGVSYKKEARHWRDTIARLGPDCTIIANADDPLVAWTVQPATDVVWVAGGLLWREDALVCRGCLLPIHWEGDAYHCDGCGLSRPEPAWRLESGAVHGPAGSVAVHTRLPGRANQVNALFAVATAAHYGVDPAAAMAAIAGITDVAGRYREYDVEGRIVRLHMTKNSASWNEVVTLLASDPDSGLVFALEDFGITGRDTATIWDSPVELLAGRRAVTSGARRHDVARRLEVAGVRVTAVADHFDAIRACPPGPVHVVANYRTFGILKKRLPS
jgi:UDP-N-acetylmuramyl tripeptide synthase